MQDSLSLKQFLDLKAEVEDVQAEINKIVEANFGKKPILKKDYETLLDLMQGALSAHKYVITFLRLAFKLTFVANGESPVRSTRSSLGATPIRGKLDEEKTPSPSAVGNNSLDKPEEAKPAEVAQSAVELAEPSAPLGGVSQLSGEELIQQKAPEIDGGDNLIEAIDWGVSPKDVLDFDCNFGSGDLSGQARDQNVSMRRRKKNVIKDNSIEDSLECLDNETLELIESGKVDLSQLCQESGTQPLNFADICRLNLQIFDSPGQTLGPWQDWRQQQHQEEEEEAAAIEKQETSEWEGNKDDDSHHAVWNNNVNNASFAASSFVLRDSVISPRQPKASLSQEDESEKGNTDAGEQSSSHETAETGVTVAKFPPSVDKEDKESSFVVLIDTRLSAGEEAETSRESSASPDLDSRSQSAGEKPVGFPAWNQDEPISPILPGGARTVQNESPTSPVSHLSKDVGPAGLSSSIKELTPTLKPIIRRRPAVGSGQKGSTCRRVASDHDNKQSEGRKIGFEKQKIYYFPRQQGWVSIPKEGGNTLGMAFTHDQEECIPIPEFSEEVKVEERPEQPPTETAPSSDDSRLERLKELERRVETCQSEVQVLLSPSADPDAKQGRPRKSLRLSTSCGNLSSLGANDEKWKSKIKKPGVLTLTKVNELKSITELENFGKATLNMTVPNWGLVDETQVRCRKVRSSNRNSKRLQQSASANSSVVQDSTSQHADLSCEASAAPRKGEVGTRGMYPLTSRARKTLLKSGGAGELDPKEAEEIKAIRQWRKMCGCSCVRECLPGVCECIESGIQCHEEREGFPCSCSGSNCNNPNGRKVFDPTSVKMHFIQTMMEVQGAMSLT